ncbi:MAG: pyridoxal phosphate-dependent aminotransferase family protein, partial [Verrucomicrobia subdivision 3 bacterium]|nr:pyridoxal phosphate-dependent aminotransferase family protein [Limisphaerales bacterium]
MLTDMDVSEFLFYGPSPASYMMARRAGHIAPCPQNTMRVQLAEPLEQVDRVFVRHRGRKLVYFGGCDYFRLASHPRIIKVLQERAAEGLGVSASRITTGNHYLYEKLEAGLTWFFGVQGAVLAPTGYTANLIVAQALAGEFSHALLDEQAHPSLRDAAKALDCPVLRYRHRDSAHVTTTVARCGPLARIILLTDGVFAQDGSLAPLPELLKALPRDATLLLDDAHGAGVLGKRGRGTLEHFGISDRRVVRTITLSKAFGAFGGAVLATKKLCNAIISRSELFIGSTPIPLPVAAAAAEALVIVSAYSDLRARMARNLKLIGTDFPIISLM